MTDHWGLTHKDIRVENMAGFGEFQKKLTSSRATTMLPASANELAKAVAAFASAKAAPAKDGVAFSELEFFRSRVRIQSGDLGKFAGEAASGLTGFGETAIKVYAEYRTADATSSKILQAPKDVRAADHDAAKAMATTASGLPYDTRGWDLKRSGTDDTDYYSIPPTDGVTPTQWTHDGDEPGDVFQRVYTILNAESPDYLHQVARLWHHIRDLLITASHDLRNGTEKNLGGWTGPASKGFHTRVLESMRSINTWHISALHRAEQIAQKADQLETAQGAIRLSYPDYLKAKALPETVDLEADSENGHMVVPWIQVDNLQRAALLLEFDTRALNVVLPLAVSLVQAANWQAPTMYPGIPATGAKVETPFVETKTDVPVRRTGGGVPTSTGVKTGGGDPRKQYEAAIKQLQQQNQDLRDAYDKQIKKLQEQAQRQIDTLQKQMQDQQKQAQDALQQTQQQAQDQLDKAQESISQSQQDAQQQIEAMQKQLQDAAAAGSAAVAGLGSIPSVIGSLGNVGSLGSLGGGSGGGSGAFGSSGTGSALSTGGSVDMLGRSGVSGTATTGLGTSALSGRSAAAANPGGTPIMPPMGGGAPATGGGGGALAGRKGRPVLPEEKKKPQAKPRIVDPDGDGTTEVRPSGGARAHSRSTDDRAATVARTRKAPETESGQALGRTA
ncbi:gas vesicle protein [Hamadaea flava]|uniref:Uncharacterized protein n=1 Tax=Hamadaea flava TaxID=1742688 RepID=A0ABV8LKZ0_9ACTN|nr:hypothetical protein [Hamadaea flava]MCP2323716.1 gas vesicle protein [Hamadaea flava]